MYWCFLGRDAQDFGALLDSSWLPSGDKREEAAQRGKTAVARTDRVVPFLLGIFAERRLLQRR
jgi:hypothetical protein